MSYSYLNTYHAGRLAISEVTVTVAPMGGDYTSIKTALASIGTPTYTNRVKLYVRNGTYEEIQMGGLDWVTIEGESRAEVIINADGLRTDVDPVSGQRYVDMLQANKHMFNLAQHMTFKNLTLQCNDVKYVFHVDTSGTSAFTLEVDNCLVKHSNGYPVGIGARDKELVYIHDSTIEKTGDNEAFGVTGCTGLYWHDAYPQTNSTRGINIVDCAFVNCGILVCQDFGGPQLDILRIHGCTTDDTKSVFYTVSNASYGGAAADVPYTISVYLDNMPALPAVTYDADRPNGGNYVFVDVL